MTLSPSFISVNFLPKYSCHLTYVIWVNIFIPKLLFSSLHCSTHYDIYIIHNYVVRHAATLHHLQDRSRKFWRRGEKMRILRPSLRRWNNRTRIFRLRKTLKLRRSTIRYGLIYLTFNEPRNDVITQQWHLRAPLFLLHC